MDVQDPSERVTDGIAWQWMALTLPEPAQLSRRKFGQNLVYLRKGPRSCAFKTIAC
jgi:hypothetical protein